MIIHDTPGSSNIARLQYDPETAELRIEFRSGRTYKYADFPPETWNQFIIAPSAGQFFNQKIKNKFKTTEV